MMQNDTILLVDDNPDFVELARRALSKTNIINPIVVAEDGVEALDYLFCRGEWEGREQVNPLLVLLDLKLPRIDGLEVLQQLRADKRTSLTPVVVLTTSSEEKDISTAYSLGCNSYIRKSINSAKLSEEIQQTGQYWLTLNQPPEQVIKSRHET